MALPDLGKETFIWSIKVKYVRHLENMSVILEICQTSQKFIRHLGNMSDISEIYQTSWKYVRHLGNMSDILVKNPIMEKKFNWSNSSGKKLIGKNCTHIFTN